METIVIANLVVYIMVCAIAIFIGLDLKRWSSWLVGLYGFFTGFWVGFFYVDILGGMEAGLALALTVMYCGAMTRRHRQRFK